MSSSPPSSPARPIADFFAAYPTFTNNPKESCTTEYRRLCRFMRWRRDSPESGQAWQDFRKAIVLQFNANFGTDAESVKAWWALCQTLGIKPVPRGLKEAQEAVCNTHVNLVDLTEAYGNPTCSFTVFDTAQELTEYTVKEHKYMPRDVPEAGEVLRTLLKYESKRKRLGGGGGSAMDVRESEGRKPKPVKGKGKKEEGKGTPNLNMSMAPRNTREVDPKPVKTRRKNESRPNLNVGPSRKGELSTAELFREVDEEVDEYEL